MIRWGKCARERRQQSHSVFSSFSTLLYFFVAGLTQQYENIENPKIIHQHLRQGKIRRLKIVCCEAHEIIIQHYRFSQCRLAPLCKQMAKVYDISNSTLLNWFWNPAIFIWHAMSFEKFNKVRRALAHFRCYFRCAWSSTCIFASTSVAMMYEFQTL